MRARSPRLRSTSGTTDRCRPILLKNSNFSVDHNLGGRRRAWRKFRQDLGGAASCAACGLCRRPAVTLICADDVRRARYSQPPDFGVFQHNRWKAVNRQTAIFALRKKDQFRSPSAQKSKYTKQNTTLALSPPRARLRRRRGRRRFRRALARRGPRPAAASPGHGARSSAPRPKLPR